MNNLLMFIFPNKLFLESKRSQIWKTKNSKDRRNKLRIFFLVFGSIFFLHFFLVENSIAAEPKIFWFIYRILFGIFMIVLSFLNRIKYFIESCVLLIMLIGGMQIIGSAYDFRSPVLFIPIVPFLFCMIGNFLLIHGLLIMMPIIILSFPLLADRFSEIPNDYYVLLSTSLVCIASFIYSRKELLLSAENFILQEKAVEAEKFASLGKMSAGLSHEINTPIGVVLSDASANTEDLEDLQKTRELSDKNRGLILNLIESNNRILKNIKIASKLINQFKQITTNQVDEFNVKEEIDIVYIVKDCVLQLKPILDKKSVSTKVTGLPKLLIFEDPLLLSQLVTIFVDNSIKHGLDESDQGEINIDISVQNKFLYLVFSDSGKGISNEIIDKIFDPFFTTRKTEGGIGLGLSIAYNIVVSSLKGSISVESNDNGGSKFIIVIPYNKVEK